MSDDFMKSPRFLSIETYVKCNATCEFCPYPTSPRIGQKISSELFHKIIDDVASATRHPELFIPCRLNEPLLDKRVFEFCAYVGRMMPTTRVGYFTNGTTINAKNVERLIQSENLGYINVSLNSHLPEEHRRLMGIDFGTVYRNLKYLHARVEQLSLRPSVKLTRVGDGTDRDLDYIAWCETEFPLFGAHLLPRFDWLGKTFSLEIGRIPQGCAQWFQLHILANGREAFCCIDDDGRFGRGDVSIEHALDIYNHPERFRLRKLRSRKAHDLCRSCNAWI
jgi:hypothetical protein